MARNEIDVHLQRIDDLKDRLRRGVSLLGADPEEEAEFGVQLASLFIVYSVAIYETCVKTILIEFARRCGVSEFMQFIQANYDRIDSRIKLENLKTYCLNFDRDAEIYKEEFMTLLDRSSPNCREQYGDMIKKRHDFAHAGNGDTTIRDAISFENGAREVIYAFYDTFLA